MRVGLGAVGDDGDEPCSCPEGRCELHGWLDDNRYCRMIGGGKRKDDPYSNRLYDREGRNNGQTSDDYRDEGDGNCVSGDGGDGGDGGGESKGGG